VLYSTKVSLPILRIKFIMALILPFMINKRIKWGWIAITLIAFAPIVLWLFAPTYPSRFHDFETTLTNLGQISGLIGTVLLSLNFILTTRLKSLEKYFRGLNDVYVKHELFGKIAFGLLLFHPLLLISKYTNGSLKEILVFLLPGAQWDNNFGVLSLGLMLVLIVLTLYLRPRYNFWKITHKFFGLALALAGLHIFLIPSDVSTYMPLRVYILAFIALGLLAYTYKTLLGWLLVPKDIFEVTDVKKLNKNVVEISFKPKKPFEYKAGQFCFVGFDDNSLGQETHPYSFVSAPHQDVIKMGIKNLGDYTKKLPGLKTGALAKIEGPFGIFNYENACFKKQIWIAGGIGITPFVSMAEDLLHRGADYDVDLFYAVNEKEDAVYLDRLQDIAKELDGAFKVHTNYFEKDGFLTADKVKEVVKSFDKKNIFVCGPPKMMEMIKKGCAELGVDPATIRSEEFSF
jgi:predicted ferric reductase